VLENSASGSLGLRVVDDGPKRMCYERREEESSDLGKRMMLI